MSKYAQYLVEEFFNCKQDFIMYTGGSGGEHLVVKLKLYSNLYRDDSIEFDTNQRINRWHIISNPFIGALGSEYSSRWKAPHIHDWSIGAFSNIILESMLRNFSYSECCSIIENTIIENSESKNKSLYRKHISGYSCFNSSNTILIDADDPIWVDYSRYLFAYKTMHKEYGDLNSVLHRLKRVPFYIHDRKNHLIEYISNHDCTDIKFNEAKLALLCSTYRYTPDQILNMNPMEATMLYVEQNMDIRSKTKDLLEVDSDRKIKMSCMFTGGYMEDMFHIDDKRFHDEMLEWHDKNLSLLSSYGHDISQWKLKG